MGDDSPLVFVSASSEDYDAADEVYRYLVQHGVAVFFSRRSLPELGNSDYRRVIDEKLDLCTHMVVVTSSRPRVESPWVEAEWGFFINAKRSGSKAGNIVTVAVSGLAARNLPPGLRYHEVIPFAPDSMPLLLGYVGAPTDPAGGLAPGGARHSLPASAPQEQPAPFSLPRAPGAADAGPGPVVKIFGIGSGGRAIIDLVAEHPSEHLVRVAIATDAQALASCLADVKLLLGTGEPGAGADPATTEAAAERARDRIRAELEPCDLAILSAGLGGGTGTGATPVVAGLARSLGVLTICLVSLPFRFEGPKRERRAREALRRLCEACDLVVPIPADDAAGGEVSVQVPQALRRLSDAIARRIRALGSLFFNRGLVNMDFADLRAVLAGSGMAGMGQGEARGADRVEAATRLAMASGLLSEPRLSEARSVVLLVEGGPDVGLGELTRASGIVQAAVGDDVDLVFGNQTDPALGDTLRVTIIGTRFPGRVIPGLALLPDA